MRSPSASRPTDPDAGTARSTPERRTRPRPALDLLALTATVALLLGTTAPLSAVAAAPAATGVVGWGDDSSGQVTAPAGLTDATAIAAGGSHSLALRSDGTVAAWGEDSSGQATVPTGLDDVVAVDAGVNHSLALRRDGTVTAWGDDGDGQATVPDGLADVTAIAAGGYHNLALHGDGTVTAWGYDFYGQATVPDGLSGVVAIAAGRFHDLALHRDGTVTAWGYDAFGQTDVPPGLTGVTAVSAGASHSLALRSDGTVVAWGSDSDGQSDVPDGLADVTAVAAGGYHSLAVRRDGTVTAWGYDGFGEASVPAGLTGATAVSGGSFHSLALGARPVFTADAPPATAPLGAPFSYTFATGGASTFELASGSLPAGLTLTSAGVLSGTPTVEGASSFTVSARTTFGTTTGAPHTLTVGPAATAPTLSGTAAAGVVGSAYDFTYTATGSPAPVVTVASGTLPPGLALDGSGRLTGTPTTAGTYGFTLRAVNPAGTVEAASTLTVSPQKATTRADLRVDVSAPTTAVKGRTFTYTLITKNAGPSTSASVFSKVVLPPTVQFVSATGSYSRIGSIVIFPRSSLANGRTVTERITVTATGTGTATAFAAAFSVRTPDPSIRSNADTAATTVR
ncbi:DUF11 domain-containing protein [Rathayibacter sp. AY1A5]|uniref:DUF11 domain-containing protein n=1 Tax=Rathayibacter sp. AY1A5 TaxID=2080523 RepID=UPI000CE77B4A|nr:DUF11 domain-containing protein [Rathayibacter sp. AY1A5]PPF13071.1 hypothetical protein C5B98_01330 [Rathayibacter sp. AY1A5]